MSCPDCCVQAYVFPWIHDPGGGPGAGGIPHHLVPSHDGISKALQLTFHHAAAPEAAREFTTPFNCSNPQCHAEGEPRARRGHVIREHRYCAYSIEIDDCLLAPRSAWAVFSGASATNCSPSANRADLDWRVVHTTNARRRVCSRPRPLGRASLPIRE